jgi:hypothetical protein
MANHCWNWACLEGDPKELKTILSRMKDYEKFNNLTDWTNHIIGEERFDKEKHSPYDVVGTRWWDVDWEDVEVDGNELVVQGSSAWSPVTHLMELLAKEFNLNVLLEFEECGCDFGGYCKYGPDGIIEDHNVSYRQWMYEQDKHYFLELFMDDVENSGLYDGMTAEEATADIMKEYEYVWDDITITEMTILIENNLKQTT